MLIVRVVGAFDTPTDFLDAESLKSGLSVTY